MTRRIVTVAVVGALMAGLGWAGVTAGEVEEPATAPPACAVALQPSATPAQCRFTSFTTRHHRAINRLSGALLVIVAAFGFWVDVAPNVG